MMTSSKKPVNSKKGGFTLIELLMVAAIIRTVFVQEDREQASKQWRETADKLRKKYPKVASLMDEAEEDVLAFMNFPREHWRQISSTNPLERVNKEIKRRAHVIGIFPNDEAIIRLVGALLSEQTDEWHTTRRYMSQESLVKIDDLNDSQIKLPEGKQEQVA